MTLKKTNPMRLLEAAQVAFAAYEYDVSDDDISAAAVARKLGVDADRVFKTLVTVSDKKEHFVFVIPGPGELDLKKAARAAGCRKLEMLPQRELLGLTGYVHGGCSPLAMKKPLPTYIDELAMLFEKIFVSAGQVGVNLELSPEDLTGMANAEFAPLIK